MDHGTRREIDKVVVKVLRDSCLTKPPIMVKDLLEYLKVNRDYYDLEDPSLLRKFWHKVKVQRHKLQRIVSTISLHALWLPNEEQILIDSSLPKPKQDWASFHDATHTILEWHRPFFLYDTAQTLDPEFQESLEAEANYGASALMFCGPAFTKDALDRACPNSGKIFC